MTSPQEAPPSPKPDRLHWLKFNPTEWQGSYSELSDEEYGLFHRAIAKLWATPGNRLTFSALLGELRVKPGSKREKVLRGLTGYALREDGEGLLYVPDLDSAVTDAIKRGSAGAAGAAARWKRKEPPRGTPGASLETPRRNPNPEDF